MKRSGITLLLLATLSGCMTPADRIAAAQAEVGEMLKLYGPACDKMGFTKDTDPWRDCILRFRAHDDERFRGSRPTTTTCVGQRGFYNCTSF